MLFSRPRIATDVQVYPSTRPGSAATSLKIVGEEKEVRNRVMAWGGSDVVCPGMEVPSW
jgi:hypothetical protein